MEPHLGNIRSSWDLRVIHNVESIPRTRNCQAFGEKYLSNHIKPCKLPILSLPKPLRYVGSSRKTNFFEEFLEDGVYVPTDVMVKQMKGDRHDCIIIQKKLSRDRVVTAYEVRDKPSAFKPEDWDRVVTVFVLGKDW
ncbi:hypothetical protein RYX36_029849 [Vicia faba]